VRQVRCTPLALDGEPQLIVASWLRVECKRMRKAFMPARTLDPRHQRPVSCDLVPACNPPLPMLAQGLGWFCEEMLKWRDDKTEPKRPSRS
jgi:hypothetical protein